MKEDMKGTINMLFKRAERYEMHRTFNNDFALMRTGIFKKVMGIMMAFSPKKDVVRLKSVTKEKIDECLISRSDRFKVLGKVYSEWNEDVPKDLTTFEKQLWCIPPFRFS
jgi:hypothetical protein